MANIAYTAFILEGEAQEPRIIENMKRCYFRDERFKIITLPAEENIYMLWKKMKSDDFETDVIEVVRESSKEAAENLGELKRDNFSQVFLFFDYDAHHKLSTDRIEANALLEMLQNFDNETESGKLYVSYPMAEVLRDFMPGLCSAATSCSWPIELFSVYKRESGNRCPCANIQKYDSNQWVEIMRSFVIRLSCLFDCDDVLSFDAYRQLSPLQIYERQNVHICQGEIF